MPKKRNGKRDGEAVISFPTGRKHHWGEGKGPHAVMFELKERFQQGRGEKDLALDFGNG